MSADFWAGYLSGAVGIVIGNPLDVIKVRLQANSAGIRGSNAFYSRQFESKSSLVRGTAPVPHVRLGIHPLTISI